MKKIFPILFCFVSLLLAEEPFNAKIYPEGDPEKLAYVHHNVVTHMGDSTIIDHYYFTQEGELHVKDRVILVEDNPVFNSLKFFRINEYSSLEKIGNEVLLTYERDGRKKQVKRKLQKPLVFAPTQQDAIIDQMPVLLDGGSANFYIFASEVLRLVKMKIKVIYNSPYERENCVVLQMKPNNVFIDWFVDEVYYVVNTQNGRIMEMHGFSTLRQEIDGKWEFRDMDFYYTYE